MKDLHGRAIWDYYRDQLNSPLILHNSYGEPEEMPVDIFFREPVHFSDIENLAIENCKGKVLDIGAGAGAHSLLLQALEIDVTALDTSKYCCQTLEKSGMSKVSRDDYRVHSKKYDTLLLLMNGIGIIGKLAHLTDFIEHCRRMLNPGGQIIVDSSDISYLYNDGLERPKGYYGEISYCYEYAKEKGDWFDWVYIDPDTLREEILSLGLNFELLLTDENDQYLCRIDGF